MVQVAAAILENEKKEVLICRRKKGGSCGELWEFPGGKREPGETMEQCLVRECREELGLEIEAPVFFARASHTYPDLVVELTFFKAKPGAGVLENHVHQEMKWVKRRELDQYAFCPGDAGLIRQLKAEEEKP